MKVQKPVKSLIKYSLHFVAISSFFVVTEAARSQVLIEIEQIGLDVVTTANGSLNLPSSSSTAVCGNNTAPVSSPPPNGAIQPNIASICVGNSSAAGFIYPVDGPSQFLDGMNTFTAADSSTGLFFGLEGNIGLIGSQYTSNTVFTSTSTYTNQTLLSLGITRLGILGEWTLLDKPGGNPLPNQTITVFATPAPLAALGLPITYGWSRRLRRRIHAAASQQQQKGA